MQDSTQGRTKLLDYLNLVSKFDGKTIKVLVSVEPMSPTIRNLPMVHHAIIDTGADTTAFTKEFLKRRGYGNYSEVGIKEKYSYGRS